jgi:hypothetical protein|tara:strand:+ start:4704 stop:4901 length:198 start_codon:yes stop_codon:yes gene_type:complete
MSFIKLNKWFLLSLTGIISFSSGLCIFGEALNLKNTEQAWFLFGTLSLILINAGVCLMIGANYKK